MRVKKTSWHYRLWRLGRENDRSEPKDFCRYFWHLLLFKIALPLLIVGLAIGGVIALAVLIWNNLFVTVISVLTTAVIIGAIIGLYFFLTWLDKRKKEQRHEARLRPVVVKEPSVVSQFFFAKKRKICPLIEVVDDRQDAREA